MEGFKMMGQRLFMGLRCRLLLLLAGLLLQASLSGQSIRLAQFYQPGDAGGLWMNVVSTGDGAASAWVFRTEQLTNQLQPSFLFLEGAQHSKKTLQLKDSERAALNASFSGEKLVGTLRWEDDTIAVDAMVCGSESDLPFVSLYQNATQKLIPGDASSPEAIIEMRITAPASKDDSILHMTISRWYQLVGDSMLQLGFAKQMESSMADFLRQYSEMSSFEGEKGPSFQWFKTVKTSVPWVNSRLLVLQKLTYVYTGGAHGMEHQEFLVVDRSKSRAIGLSDLFTEGSADSLGVLLTAKLQQQAGVQQGESLTSKGYFVDTVPVAGNFFLHPAGITFYYNSYELAPYAFGHTALTLSFREIKDLLRPECELILQEMCGLDK